MRNTIYSFILGLVFILSGVLVLPSAFAQDVPANQPGLNYDTAPGSETTNPGVGGTTNTVDDAAENNLWWLLPLLAIPVLFFVFRRSEEKDRDFSYGSGGYAVGAKGGQSKRTATDEWSQEEEVL